MAPQYKQMITLQKCGHVAQALYLAFLHDLVLDGADVKDTRATQGMHGYITCSGTIC